jgi:hypothetical protein
MPDEYGGIVGNIPTEYVISVKLMRKYIELTIS